MTAPDHPLRIALLGNYPPRLCGIATFTADVRAALVKAYPTSRVDVYAMDDGMAEHAYPPEVTGVIPDGDTARYAAVAAEIAQTADLLLVQHEYGIFGGVSGSHLLGLLDAIDLPVVVTLHTVLQDPSPDQRRVLDAIAARASRLIVMAEKGRALLEQVHGIDPDRIVVVPHGVPDRPLIEPNVMKPRFGFGTRPVVLTFGLLSPNKGIETMIRALPGIADEHPDMLYVVLGATHPNLVATDGEAYRDSLVALADELGVAGNVRFVDGFLETPLLLEYLAAADVYVTPYLNEAQITSGTLSYAVAVGKPVVSTPYWHAAELLAEGVGILCPFQDSDAFADAVSGLLSNKATRDSMRKRAWAAGRAMTWQKLAESYMRECRAALAPAKVPVMTVFGAGAGAAVTPLIPVRVHAEIARAQSLGAVERMTDGCGMIQHAVGLIPDRSHGYCVDDNARALMLMHRIDGPLEARADALAFDYAAFVQHSWNPDAGRFRNFMSYARDWLEAEGSEDSSARALWSLGVTAVEARDARLASWARALFTDAAPAMLTLASPRAQAFAILAADAVLGVEGAHQGALALIAGFGPVLEDLLTRVRTPDWVWFETSLAYDNARLPHALLRAGRRLGDDAMRDAALDALGWLCGVQTGEGGVFRAFGSTGFGQDGLRVALYDQQPLEAWATVDACAAAFALTDDPSWRGEASRAYAWFAGRNDAGLPVASDGDGCFDGLTPTGVNRNQGAESILSYGMASEAMARLGRGRTELAPDTGDVMRPSRNARLVAAR